MKKTLISIFGFLFVFVVLSTNICAYSFTTYGNNLSYNRQAAKNYVYNHTTHPNDNDYYDFTRDGGDCTSFASQALRAGGIAFTARVSNPTINHWYYYNSSWGMGRTSTWTTAHQFRQHFAEVNGSGYKRAYQFRKYQSVELVNENSAWNNLFDNIGAGDIVQYTKNGNTYHSQVVHRKSTGEEGPGIKKVSMGQHTPNEWKNLRASIGAMRDTSTNYRWVTVIRVNSATTW